MSDRRIDELPVKSAAQLALTDFLIGHGDGAPAAFRSELDEVLDFLGPTLVSRFSDDIVGEVVERAGDDAAGYVRLADGTQIAWVNVVTDAMNTVIGSLFASSYTAGEPWPAAFAGTPVTMAAAVSNSGNSPRWFGQGTSWGTATHTPSAWAVTFASTTNTATLRYLGFGRWK